MEHKENRPVNLHDPGTVTVRQALREGAEFLSRMGAESARLDAELLLGMALGCPREKLCLNHEMALGFPVKDLYCSLLERRARREPLSYIVGRREFWSLEFYVAPEVLVPRPETEMLVEVTLGLAKELNKNHPIKILDLGTGSGAVAVSLAKELGDVEIWATDLSARCLEVARSNALRHGVEEKIHFLQGDLFDPVKGQLNFFDMVVSNPPYVRRRELKNLPPEVREWEPKAALDGGEDGLDFYRRIMAEGHLYLVDGGFVVLEIGADMGEEVCRLSAKAVGYSARSVRQDYAGKDRIVITQKLASDTIYRGQNLNLRSEI